MTTALTERAAGGGIVNFNTDQIDLIKRTLLVPSKRQATHDELALFIGQAKRTGLDPFSRQIYGVYRWDSRSNGEKMTIQASIDGLRLVAERSGHYLGQSGPFWCGDDGEWRDIWPKTKGRPVAAKVVVRKLISGQIAETPAVAHWDEYVQTKRDGSPTQMWAGMPALMLAKCAEALALRKAFPNDLSGLYTAEEMSRADVPVQAPAAAPAGLPETASDIPSDTSGFTHTPPAREPGETARLAGMTADIDNQTGELLVDETFARDLATEMKRQGVDTAPEFRAYLKPLEITVPSDIASARKRWDVVRGLSATDAEKLEQALLASGVKDSSEDTK